MRPIIGDRPKSAQACYILPMGILRIARRLPWKKILKVAAVATGVGGAGIMTGANEEIVEVATDPGAAWANAELWLGLFETVMTAGIMFLREWFAKRGSAPR